MINCIMCKTKLNTINSKYCSNQCQGNYQYDEYIRLWKSGIKSGSRGIETGNMSRHVSKYIHSKFGKECSVCNWSEINLLTGKVPLEIDHIDGNHNNNIESNLRLICPNCHSLTSNFRNLNYGNGRKWRRDKYNKV